MADLSLTELIDTEVLNTNGQFFRNREIVLATGASRQHVSQRMNALWDEGIVEKHGQSWHVVNQGKLVTRLLRAAKSHEITTTKLIRPPGETLTRLTEAILLIQGSPNAWQGVAHQLEDFILQDIEESLESLRNLRSQLRNPPKSGKQIYAHTVNSGEYAAKLQECFVEGAKYFMGKELTEEVITEDIRARALERQNNG